MEKKRAPLREIFGWCMFDFANSSYTTVIISVSYCIIFSEIIVPSGDDPKNPHSYGNFLWAVALAISYVLVMLTGPVFGAITDFSAKKKLFLFLSYIFCVISTSLLWLAEKPGEIWLPFVLIIVSNFMFASSENFASSFLPSLGPKEELGKISGYAWGIGYFGGILSLLFVMKFSGEIKPENYQNLRLVGPLTAFFFMLSGIPTFLLLKEHPVAVKPDANISFIRAGFHRIRDTLYSIKDFRDMMIYLISLFFAMAALGVVISFAFIYGSQEIKIGEFHKQVMFILIQVTAALGAFLFGILQDKLGAKRTFNLTLILWILGLLCIYWIQALTNLLHSMGLKVDVQWVFVSLTALSGMGLGATQSASRAIVGLLSPESKSGEFFGLWGLSGKLAVAFGLFIVAYLQTIIDLRNSFLVVALFFFISFVLTFWIDEKRGLEVARNYKELDV